MPVVARPVGYVARDGAVPVVSVVPRPGRRRGRPVVPVVVGLALAALVLAMLPRSGSVFAAKVANGGDSLGAADYFTCANAITAAGPRFYYKLDDTTGTTVTDSSGQGRNGTYVGTVTKSQDDACARDTGTAVLFNGSTGYVSYGTSLQIPTVLSLEAWVKTTSTRGGLVAGFGASATGASGTVDRVLYLTSAGKAAFGINNASKTAIVSSASVNDGKWHHLVASLGTGGSKVYVDGVESASGSTVATATYAGYFRVGYDNLSGWPSVPTSSFLNATLDEVAVYTTALSATDAAAHYQAGT